MAIEVTWDYRNPYQWMERTAKCKFPPLMISVAITGGYHGKESNPNLPETIEEQVEAVYEAYNAGAVAVHIHARDPKNITVATPDKEILAKINQEVRRRCPGIIVNNSTGVGQGYTEEEKMQILFSDDRPDMASLNPGPFMGITNLKERKAPLSFPRPAIYKDDMILPISYADVTRAATYMKENSVKPEVEIFHNQNWRVIQYLIERKLLDTPIVLQMVFGNLSGCLPHPMNVLNMVNEAPDNSIIFLPAMGAYQLPINVMAIILGLHVRVGMEDNVYYRKGELCKSNAQQVERIVRIANELNRPIATVAEAREMLGLPKA